MSGYPLTCTLCKPPVVLQNDPELVTHHTSEHSSIKIADYKSALNSAGKPPPPPDPPKSKPRKDPISDFGFTLEDFKTVKLSSISSGGKITKEAISSCMVELGDSLDPKITVNEPRFIIEFFRLCLEHAATDKPEGLGGLELWDRESSLRHYITWDFFQNFATKYFKLLGFTYTNRRLMDTYEPVFWSLWSNPEIDSLNDLREEGTPRSREWRHENGDPVAAYVVVPGLFNNHLTKREILVRKAYRKAAGLDTAGSNVTHYLGLNGSDAVEGDINRRVLEESQRDVQANLARNAERAYNNALAKSGVQPYQRSPDVAWS
jgi:hypothetical protein